MPNDGIFDWTAVDVAVRGLRVVRLSWVEREVAAITMYLKGLQPSEIEKRLACSWNHSRWEKIRAIAEGFDG